ncbi:HAD family hydrolase [Dyadobacter flavalbus]|uniref:D,D-heptose 1,7-bisphosphate phosphatase n=1 Tax=Dyadobacter flavalbus TaxID=2579942 RepID=A0A5M8R0W0_9BACT|nr:HAD family hydrolase [Dyadobacter flavalbus]KAA6440930.1 HAD family hydrolase [Dyadobacter flavalbus]
MSVTKTKCVFLDRDGVLNVDRPNYVYNLDDLVIPEGVAEALQLLKKAGYLLIVITNQAGIAKGLYSADNVLEIHKQMQLASGGMLDDIYFSPFHQDYSGNSLSRKPDSLMLEKAMAKYNIDPDQSWMVGDHNRDMKAGRKAGVKTIHITSESKTSEEDYTAADLLEAAHIILGY